MVVIPFSILSLSCFNIQNQTQDNLSCECYLISELVTIRFKLSISVLFGRISVSVYVNLRFSSVEDIYLFMKSIMTTMPFSLLFNPVGLSLTFLQEITHFSSPTLWFLNTLNLGCLCKWWFWHRNRQNNGAEKTN